MVPGRAGQMRALNDNYYTGLQYRAPVPMIRVPQGTNGAPAISLTGGTGVIRNNQMFVGKTEDGRMVAIEAPQLKEMVKAAEITKSVSASPEKLTSSTSSRSAGETVGLKCGSKYPVSWRNSKGIGLKGGGGGENAEQQGHKNQFGTERTVLTSTTDSGKTIQDGTSGTGARGEEGNQLIAVQGSVQGGPVVAMEWKNNTVPNKDTTKEFDAGHAGIVSNKATKDGGSLVYEEDIQFVAFVGGTAGSANTDQINQNTSAVLSDKLALSFQQVRHSSKSDDLLINPLLDTNTLASAAELESKRASMNVVVPQMMTGANGVALQNTTVSVVRPPNIGDLDDKKDGEWMDVCFTKGTNYAVKHYYNVSEKLSTLKPDTDVAKDMEFIKKRIDLQPGYAYKFRVAAVNACGRGPWSEVAAFKTCLIEFPSSPSAIKISKAVDGVCISWEPPHNSMGEIVEYSVYLAVRQQINAPQVVPKQNQGGGLSFVRAYCGISNNCTIPNEVLVLAQVDMTTAKPAIVFRIAAKNEKGYGPATQVRWIQESAFPTSNLPTPVTATAAKRGYVKKDQGSAKKTKTEK